MIPLAVPNLTGNEKKYLINCIDTTYVSSVGEYVNQFEGMVSRAVGGVYAVAASSGTAGLHAALTSVGVRHGDLVILPTFTFIASANAVAQCGAQPWLMDISSSDWCLDHRVVRSEIRKNCVFVDGKLVHRPTGKRVSALMPVYTLGAVPDMAAFRSIADEYGIPLVADAACAIGAKLGDMDFGPLADLSVLSFNGNKAITCGGGGAVAGVKEELVSHVRHLTTTARVWPDYDFDEAGFNYRMTNLQAAVGCAQMERLESFISMKRKIRQYYEKAFSSLLQKGYSFFPYPDGCSCWFSGVVLPVGASFGDVKGICKNLMERGIETRPFWKPVHLQKPYKNCPKSSVDVAESIWERIITLPCSTNISDEDIQYVAGQVLEVLNSHKSGGIQSGL